MAFRYPEGRCDGGQLRYRQGIPILEVAGTPAEIGKQVGTLAGKPGDRILDYPYDYLKFQIKIPFVPALVWRLLRRKCEKLVGNLPAEYREELEAMAAFGGDRKSLVAGNFLFDMTYMGYKPLFGCSSFVVRPERSRTGHPMLGRNLDFFPLGYLPEYSLVTIYKPAGKIPFAAVGFPGTVGCFSGMNRAGLALTRNEILTPKMKRRFNARGTPFMICIRRVLETCETVAQAKKVIEATEHMTVSNLVLCDRAGGMIVEMSPEGVRCREATADAFACTNHFVSADFANPAQTNEFATQDRFRNLDAAVRNHAGPLGVPDVLQALDVVNQNDLTLQTMIFEPVESTLHVAFGNGPTTRQPLVAIELKEFGF